MSSNIFTKVYTNDFIIQPNSYKIFLIYSPCTHIIFPTKTENQNEENDITIINKSINNVIIFSYIEEDLLLPNQSIHYVFSKIKNNLNSNWTKTDIISTLTSYPNPNNIFYKPLYTNLIYSTGNKNTNGFNYTMNLPTLPSYVSSILCVITGFLLNYDLPSSITTQEIMTFTDYPKRITSRTSSTQVTTPVLNGNITIYFPSGSSSSIVMNIYVISFATGYNVSFYY